MSSSLRILSSLTFKNRFNISQNYLWLVVGFCLIPFLTLNISGDQFATSNAVSQDKIFTNIWTIFGISVALFTGILAFIDYYIRREITITLFGLTLLGSAILDVYYLFIINEKRTSTINFEEKLYFIFLINRLLYGVTLFVGTYYYLKIPAKKLRTNKQKNKIIVRIAICYTSTCVGCLLIMSNIGILFRSKVLLDNIKIDLLSFLPLIVYGAWAFLLLPKFMLRFKNVFSKLLVLSIAPLFLAQLFISMSSSEFDSYFNDAHYLRFISYIIPLIGIVLNYIETYTNEQKIISKLAFEIKEKQAVTENLFERERLLAHSENISKLGSWDYNIKTGILKWSDELYKIYGFDSKSFEPSLAIQDNLVSSSYKAKLKKEIRNALNNKTSFAVEYQIVLANGTKKFVLGQGYFSPKDNKLIGTIQDITELKQAILKLKDNESLLREAEAVSHNGSWEWKLKSNEVYWSDEMYNIYGYLPHSIVISPEISNSFLHKEDTATVKDIVKRAIEKKEHFEATFRILRPNGEIRHIYTKAKCKRNEIDNNYSYVGNSQDVTLLKETERKLQEKLSELNASNKDLEQFAYVASHDLQEPLRKIKAFGERLKTKFNAVLPEDGQDFIDRMQNAAERMQTLIDDLLTFSKATRAAKEFVETDLSSLINQVITELDYTIESSNAIISVIVDQRIDAIPSQLALVFQNIISNSLKFIKPEIQPQIQIEAKNILGITLNIPGAISGQEYCIINIKDNGIGFDESYAGKIFDLFQRLHTRSEYKGTGIGLAICKKIVENHKGFIFAKGEEEKGASFFIVLPLKQI